MVRSRCHDERELKVMADQKRGWGPRMGIGGWARPAFGGLTQNFSEILPIIGQGFTDPPTNISAFVHCRPENAGPKRHIAAERIGTPIRFIAS